jgi:hypothetical protein
MEYSNANGPPFNGLGRQMNMTKGPQARERESSGFWGESNVCMLQPLPQ